MQIHRVLPKFPLFVAYLKFAYLMWNRLGKKTTTAHIRTIIQENMELRKETHFVQCTNNNNTISTAFKQL